MKTIRRPEIDTILTYRANHALYRHTPKGEKTISLWFYRQKVKHDPLEPGDPEILYVWKVSLYIGAKKDAKRWSQNKRKKEITGDGTIGSLKWALDMILLFRDSMGFRQEMHIEGEDERRAGAYRWLLRHNFREDVNEDGNTYYTSRNPKYWEQVK